MKKRNSATMTMCILVVAFTCLIVNPAMAGNQPPEGFHPKGPAIKAEITFTEGEYGVIFSGSGACQGKPVVFAETEIAGETLDDVTPESLLDNFILFPTGLPLGPDGYAADCIPLDAPGMIVRAVIDFQDEGTYKFAEVILLFVVPK